MTDAAPVTPAQIRAGRALLGWSQEQLAEAAGVGLSSVRDFEKERRGSEVGAVRAIRRALENHPGFGAGRCQVRRGQGAGAADRDHA